MTDMTSTHHNPQAQRWARVVLILGALTTLVTGAILAALARGQQSFMSGLYIGAGIAIVAFGFFAVGLYFGKHSAAQPTSQAWLPSRDRRQ